MVKNQPDVLCLQETKCVDEKFPYRKFMRRVTRISHTTARRLITVSLSFQNIRLIGLQKGFPDEDPDTGVVVESAGY